MAMSLKKRTATICLFLLATLTRRACGQTSNWAKSYGGTSFESGYGVAVDSSGNTYVIGRFISSPISFGSITISKIDTRLTNDAFVLKLSKAGVETWAVR